MKEKAIKFLVGFFVMGFFYGLILYFFEKEYSTTQVIKAALFFGFFWGLAEVFLFPWIRKKFGKKEK